jgi:quinol monooxygenase YgiN
MSAGQEIILFLYQIKVAIKPYKIDEFQIATRLFRSNYLKAEGCLDYMLCRDSVKENIYSMIGEWKTLKAMEDHFLTLDFVVLIGAAKVLGETFAMNVAEVTEMGGFELAKELIASK